MIQNLIYNRKKKKNENFRKNTQSIIDYLIYRKLNLGNFFSDTEINELQINFLNMSALNFFWKKFKGPPQSIQFTTVGIGLKIMLKNINL